MWKKKVKNLWKKKVKNGKIKEREREGEALFVTDED